MMKKILLLHTDSNINNNPNLTGIVEILGEQGYQIDIYSKKNINIYQASPCPNAHLYLEDANNFEELILLTVQKYCTPYSLIIGVDQEAIIEASHISRMQNIPYGLLSYEIFFADEINGQRKKEEIDACKNISFAIVQDKTRGEMLAKENHIDEGKIIHIPVAGRGSTQRNKNTYLHEKFGIDKNKRIALFIGSVLKWSLIDELIDSVAKWSDDWVLVIHNRYGLYGLYDDFIEKLKSTERIFFSSEPFSTFNDLSILLNSATVGIAFYQPTYTSKYDGKNIQHIGLSSGKIATYLQHGLPIVTNSIEPWRYYTDTFNIGMTVEDIHAIETCFTEKTFTADLTLNCHNFFKDYLDLNNKITPLLERVSQETKNRNYDFTGIDSIFLSNTLNDLIVKETKIRETEAACTAVENLKKSTTYKLCAELQKMYGRLKNILAVQK